MIIPLFFIPLVAVLCAGSVRGTVGSSAVAPGSVLLLTSRI